MAIEQLNARWGNASPEDLKEYEQEGLILQVTEGIWKVLKERGWNKTDLANALGTSKSNVTQLLNGSRNMTLRTLSDICFALGATVRVYVGEPKTLRFSWDDFARLEVGDGGEVIEFPEAGNSLSYERDEGVNDQAWGAVQIRKVAA